jgi:hypothetical protein
MSNPPSPKLQYQPRRNWRNDAGHRWHRFASRFTRENVVSHLKTIAWVIPLTMLIWIYAEREQVDTPEDVAVPFELFSADRSRVVSLKPPQDKNLILKLQGPRAKLSDVVAKLHGGLLPTGLRIEVPAAGGDLHEYFVDALPLVKNQKIFVDSGVSVLGCQPAKLAVLEDSYVEREAKVVRPPDVTNVVATFDPPTVKVKGPLMVLTRAEKAPRAESPGKLVLYGDLHDEAMKPAGHYEPKEVVLRRPPELEDERVSISGPTTIRASVDVRPADKTLLIRSMPVTLDVTDSLWDKYAVTDFKGVLQNVTVTGPPEIIDAMQKPDFEPKPKARVVVTPQDAGDRRSKPVAWDMPEGVKVIDADKNRTVEFRLVDKSTVTPGL